MAVIEHGEADIPTRETLNASCSCFIPQSMSLRVVLVLILLVTKIEIDYYRWLI